MKLFFTQLILLCSGMSQAVSHILSFIMNINLFSSNIKGKKMDVPYLFDLSIGYYTANLESSFSEVVWKNMRHKLPNEDIIKGGFSTGL